MKIRTNLIPILAASLLGSTLVSAHTRFETATVQEGVRMLNNVTIGHACGTDTRVIGTSVVFPDGKDSSILVNGVADGSTLTDHVSNWGPNIQPLFTTSPFAEVDEKNDVNGNVVGFFAGGGPGMPNHMLAYVPFRLNATNIVPTSCAVSVKFYASIVDVCNITDADKLHQEGNAHFWTPNNLGTIFDRVSETDDGPAPLKITRDLEANPLPPSCGAGVTVEVRPSAGQINRDMPIVFEGVQVWPTP